MVLDIMFGIRTPQTLGNYYLLSELDPAALGQLQKRFPETHWFDGQRPVEADVRIQRRRRSAGLNVAAMVIYNPGAWSLEGRLNLLCRREVDYRFTNFVFPEVVELNPLTLEPIRYRTLPGRIPRRLANRRLPMHHVQRYVAGRSHAGAAEEHQAGHLTHR